MATKDSVRDFEGLAAEAILGLVKAGLKGRRGSRRRGSRIRGRGDAATFIIR
jgi:hypothetical protein